MKTSKKSSFSVLGNKPLENKLDQLVNDYSIMRIFYKKDIDTLRCHIVVQVHHNSDAVKLRSTKWVAEVRKLYQVYIYLIDHSRMEYQFSKGQPFVEYHCQKASIIYQNEKAGSSHLIDRGWKKYKNKFNRYENEFHHDHEIRRIYLERLIREDSYNSVFTSYEELIKYDLEYLEELYSGNRTSDIDLNQRINKLLIYLPELQSYFVRKNQQEYFISELFAKAKRAIEGDDIIYDTEMFESLRIVQDALFTFIETRFFELKHLIKKQDAKIYEVDQDVVLIEETPKDNIIQTAIEKILTFVELEQIYLFHQTTYGEVTTYYMLLIGMNVNNGKLRSINQSLKSMFGDKYGFLLLSHDRYWIQKNLYQYQNFFVFIMQYKYLVFSSDQYHPEPHWQIPHHPQHNDLYFHYRVTIESALQFQKLIDGEKENYQGISNIFSLFFLSFCRTYIFVKTYYIPNYLTSESLWQLCIYADKNLLRYNYLIEQFFTDIFPFIDYNMRIHHQQAKIDKVGTDQMKTIVDTLIKELKNVVIDGKLLTDFELELMNEKTTVE